MAIASDSFAGVDLSRLPAPDVVEALDFETIYGEAVTQFQGLFPDFDATVESDPVVKLIQLFCYRELVVRQRVNDAARAVMVAYAKGADLDALAALFRVERFILSPADPYNNIAAVYEADDDLRRRMVLAPEGYSVAGPEGAYIYHALSASSDVLDASATSPSPGVVVVSVLSRSGDGTASQPTLDAVAAKLTDQSIRPLTDLVTVQSAAVVGFDIAATLYFFSGPDRSVVMAAAEKQLADYLTNARKLGRDINRAGIIAALHPEGVQNVILHSPANDIVLSRQQAQHCVSITIHDAGVAE